jgi:hypothetical protein
MQTTLIVGASGQGKTFFAKEKFIYGKKNVLVFDINNEYFEDKRQTDPKLILITAPKLPVDTTQPRSRYIGGDMDEFVTIATAKRNTNIVFDEASIFFNGRITEKELLKLILTRKHTHNNIILCFHSLEEVPRFMYRQSNFIVLFKTQDTEKAFTSKSDFLKPYWLKLQKMKDHSYIIIPR